MKNENNRLLQNELLIKSIKINVVFKLCDLIRSSLLIRRYIHLTGIGSIVYFTLKTTLSSSISLSPIGQSGPMDDAITNELALNSATSR